MSTHTASLERPSTLPVWAQLMLRREVWGGVTLVTIWLTVLFVGLFGGDIHTSAADGSANSFPVVVIVALVALFATISVGHWAFRAPRREDGELRDAGGTADSRR